MNIEQPPTTKGSQLGVAITIVVVLFFASSLFVPFFLTTIAELELDTWQRWVGARVAWHLGGPLALAILVLVARRGMRPKPRPSALVLIVGGPLLLGTALGFNAIRALIEGPTIMTGPAMLQVTRGRSSRLFADLQVQVGGGEVARLAPAGNQARRLVDGLARCSTPGDRVRVVVLEPLDAILEASCD